MILWRRRGKSSKCFGKTRGLCLETSVFLICYVNRMQRKPTNKGKSHPFGTCFCCPENNTYTLQKMHQIIKSTNKIPSAKAETLNARDFVNALKSSAYSCFSVAFVVYIIQKLTRSSLRIYKFENRKREKPPNISISGINLRPKK